MKHSTIFIITLIGYNYIVSNRVNGYKIYSNNADKCIPCGHNCGKCEYGTFENYCQQLECARGPYDDCGDIEDGEAKCGSGLLCRCGHCMGCFNGNTKLCTEEDEDILCTMQALFH